MLQRIVKRGVGTQIVRRQASAKKQGKSILYERRPAEINELRPRYDMDAVQNPQQFPRTNRVAQFNWLQLAVVSANFAIVTAFWRNFYA
jgi:hypothetical protein